MADSYLNFFDNIYVFSIVKNMIKVTKNRYLLWYDICIWLPKVLGRFANNYTIYSTQLGLNKQSPKYTLYVYVNNTYARRTLNENTLGSDNTIKLGYVCMINTYDFFVKNSFFLAVSFHYFWIYWQNIADLFAWQFFSYPLLIRISFLKNQFGKIKFDKLDF